MADKHGVQQLHERIEVLLAHPVSYREDSNKQELQPPAMTLSHEAKQALVAFYNQVEAETGQKQTLEPVRSAGEKKACRRLPERAEKSGSGRRDSS